MTHQGHTWTCTCCGREFIGSAAMPPPDWEWRGSRLVCDDCGRSGDESPKGPTGPAPLRDGAEAIAPAKASIPRIKREAKKLKKMQGIKHTQSLEVVARSYGYQNYRSALAELGQ